MVLLSASLVPVMKTQNWALVAGESRHVAGNAERRRGVALQERQDARLRRVVGGSRRAAIGRGEGHSTPPAAPPVRVTVISAVPPLRGRSPLLRTTASPDYGFTVAVIWRELLGAKNPAGTPTVINDVPWTAGLNAAVPEDWLPGEKTTGLVIVPTPGPPV